MLNLSYLKNFDNDFTILLDNIKVGYFRFYENTEIEINGKNLTNFLGYIWIKPAFRKKGILKQLINDFDVKTLCIDDIDDISFENLTKIYESVGFKPFYGKKQFVYRY